MKLKYVPIVAICLLYFGILSGIFIDSINAQESYKISITDKSYEISNIQEINGQTIIYYNISITLSNLGDVISDDITLKIVGDDGLPLYRNASILPGDVKKFEWASDEFFLVGATDHYINISYYPTDSDIEVNSDNSGEDVLILKYTGNTGDNNTPGFESVLFILILVGYIIYTKFRR